jgi:hypothetical protein
VAAECAESRPEVLAAAKRALLFGEGHGMAESMKNEQEAGAALRKAR